MNGSSLMYIKREVQWVDSLRKYKICVDDQEIGVISIGEKKDFEIKPGEHEIFLKIDWGRSNKLSFNIKENQKINFACGCSIKGWKYLIGIIYAVFLRKKYLYVEVDQSS